MSSLLRDFIPYHRKLQPSLGWVAREATRIFATPFSDITHLAYALGRFARILPRGIVDCPVFVVEERNGKLALRIELHYRDQMLVVQKLGSTTPCHNGRPHGHAGYNSQYAIVGYDVEFVVTKYCLPNDQENGLISKDLTMVSHQFYFSLGLEHVCLVLLTNKRFTQKALVRAFLAQATPDRMIVYTPPKVGEGGIKPVDAASITKQPITKVFIAAHFSLIEGGLLIPSYDKVTR